MDELIFLLFLFWLFRKAFKKKKPAPKAEKPAAMPVSETVFPKRELSREAKRRAERAIRMHDAIQQRKEEEQVQLSMDDVSEGQPMEGQSCALHQSWMEIPMEAREEYTGSLHVDSSEGEDLCDPELGHADYEPSDPESVYANEIGAAPTLDLSARGIWQGVVMSEVLARPVGQLHRR